jgi:hypothetical protein
MSLWISENGLHVSDGMNLLIGRFNMDFFGRVLYFRVSRWQVISESLKEHWHLSELCTPGSCCFNTFFTSYDIINIHLHLVNQWPDKFVITIQIRIFLQFAQWCVLLKIKFLYIFFTGSTAPLGPGLCFFQFHEHFTDGRTPWTSDQFVARPLPKHRTTQTQNKHIHTQNIHALCGIRNHDPSFRASEDSACLRPLGYCDQLLCIYILHISRKFLNYKSTFCPLSLTPSFKNRYITSENTASLCQSACQTVIVTEGWTI